MTLFICLLMMAGSPAVQADGEAPVPDTAAPTATLDVAGRWYTPKKKTIVEIYDCGNATPCGRVAWIDPDMEQENLFTDVNNPDEDLKGRPLTGAVILSDFNPEPRDDQWYGGDIYNPANGRTYGAKLNLEDNGDLRVKGCVGPICKGMIWTKAP